MPKLAACLGKHKTTVGMTRVSCFSDKGRFAKQEVIKQLE